MSFPLRLCPGRFQVGCAAFRRGLVGFCLVLGLVAPAAEPITLQLKWYHQFQFAGYYAAEAKGYYREAGLEVHLAEASASTNVVEEVLSGHAQYGVADSRLVIQRIQGKPVVVLAVIFQHSPSVMLVRRMGATHGVQDLLGRKVMLAEDETDVIAFLRHAGVPLDRLVQVPHSYQIGDLIHGQVDAVSAYVTNELYDLDRTGFPYLSYTPRAAGIDFYGDNLFTSEQELKNHPERVKAFRTASLRGWEYAMDHPEEIVDLILAKYSKRKDRDQLLYEAHQMNDLLQPELVEIGYMHPDRWHHITEALADLGMMPRNAPVTGFFYVPEPPRDLTWVLRGALAALIAVGVAFFFSIHRKKPFTPYQCCGQVLLFSSP